MCAQHDQRRCSAKRDERTLFGVAVQVVAMTFEPSPGWCLPDGHKQAAQL